MRRENDKKMKYLSIWVIWRKLLMQNNMDFYVDISNIRHSVYLKISFYVTILPRLDTEVLEARVMKLKITGFK